MSLGSSGKQPDEGVASIDMNLQWHIFRQILDTNYNENGDADHYFYVNTRGDVIFHSGQRTLTNITDITRMEFNLNKDGTLNEKDVCDKTTNSK